MKFRGGPLADPATPLGMIQRGRGAGFLWAREHPAAARALLTLCLERDPRQIPQIESRAEYCVEMAQAIGFGAPDLNPLLSAGKTQQMWKLEDGNSLALSVLVGLALAGDEAARALVVEHVSDGASWIEVLEHLSWAADDWASDWALDPRTPWPALPDAVFARLGDSAERDALVEWRAQLFRQFATWPPWSASADLRRFVEDNSEELAQIAEELTSPPPGTVHVHTDGYRAKQGAGKLIRAARKDDAAVPALHRALREDTRIAYYAWMQLGVQGDTTVLDVALETLPERRGYGNGPGMYLRDLPGEATLPVARALVTRSDRVYSEMGWSLLARHATAADVPVLYAELLSALAAGDFEHASPVLCGLARNPESGPYPAARACFEAASYGPARHSAARLLRLTDPHFAEELAFECLWDCESETRELAVEVIAAATSEIRDRIAAITAARSRP